jgi:hypothetical protein
MSELASTKHPHILNSNDYDGPMMELNDGTFVCLWEMFEKLVEGGKIPYPNCSLALLPLIAGRSASEQFG